ncbi:MAG: hypothetical protein ACRDRW_01330, partial [Pseudonocardiaceae bacterium]
TNRDLLVWATTARRAPVAAGAVAEALVEQLLARVRERESMVARRLRVIAELKRCLTVLATMVSM